MRVRFCVAAMFITYSGRRVGIRFTKPFVRVGENEYRRVKEKLADEYAQKTQQPNTWTPKGDPIVGCDYLTLIESDE